MLPVGVTQEVQFGALYLKVLKLQVESQCLFYYVMFHFFAKNFFAD